MLAAARGEPYHVPYGGRFDLQYTDDVAKTFIRATRAPFEGADVFNLRGSVVHMREVVNAIEAVEPDMRGKISFDDIQLPLPEEVDGAPLAGVLGPLPYRTLAEGVEATIGIFKRAVQDGEL
jgi:nucleoside-diphosphate-sugar epimerase